MDRKSFDLDVKSAQPNGGRVVITVPAVDRDRDRIDPLGIDLENYRKNPTVIFGHEYRAPWAVIGKTTALDVSPAGIVATFELRPAANESDPQHIVRLLWGGGWLKTASIGFTPIKWEPNELGGKDYSAIELLEWSLVPVPAQASAISLAAKALGGGRGAVAKSGDGGAWDYAARKSVELEDLRREHDALLAAVGTMIRSITIYLREVT
jgi:HK97 family phage prohead protease